MPVDKKYLEKFYDKSPDSPKAQITKEKFLANAEYFFNEMVFTRAFLADREFLLRFYQQSPDSPRMGPKMTDAEFLAGGAENFLKGLSRIKAFVMEPSSLGAERDKPENIIVGWDALVSALKEGIEDEAKRLDFPDIPQLIYEINVYFEGLTKLLIDEMGRPDSMRRITNEELEKIVSSLWKAKSIWPDGILFGETLIEIRTGLIRKGLREYATEYAIKPPGWDDFHWIVPKADDEGFEYVPPYSDFLTYGEDKKRGFVRLDFEPWHEAAPEFFVGRKYNPHWGDPKFYKLEEKIKNTPGFNEVARYVFDPEGNCKCILLEPQKHYFIDERTGKRHSIGRNLHSILVHHFLSVAPHAMVDTRINRQYEEMKRYFAPSLAYKRIIKEARQQKLKVPSKVPSHYIFKFNGIFTRTLVCFANINAWYNECGLVNLGEYSIKLPITGPKPVWAEMVQIAVKNMGTHLVMRVRWVDPIFLPSHRKARQFLLVGIKFWSMGKIHLTTGAKGAIKEHIICALECPTPGVIDIPFLGPGLPLHHEEFYDLWQKGKAKGIYAGAQLFTIFQPRPDRGIVPCSSASVMPYKPIFFQDAPPPPKGKIIEV